MDSPKGLAAIGHSAIPTAHCRQLGEVAGKRRAFVSIAVRAISGPVADSRYRRSRTKLLLDLRACDCQGLLRRDR
jgi:hypothetical protein